MMAMLWAMLRRLACLGAAVWLGGCLSGLREEPRQVESELTNENVDLVAPQSSAGRPWRRMNLDQLIASVDRVSGGVHWTEVDATGKSYDAFESLAGSLGRADYLNSTVEDLLPGLLFQKFLDDGASSVCKAWLARERATVPSERTFLVALGFADEPTQYPAQVETILRSALLRFHGRSVPAGDPRLDPWKELVTNLFEATHDVETTWQGVCVALFTHPDFYTF